MASLRLGAPSHPDGVAGRAAPVALSVGLGSWLLATAASQHPHRAFDGLRRFDPVGLGLPNWRFFAPEPAQHDYHVLHRVLAADGTQGEWVETSTISPRRWSHVLFFPDRRREKGLFDVASELSGLMVDPRIDLTRTVPFELLRNAVELRVRADHAGGPAPRGFQFLLARHTGHDEEPEPEYLLASPFIPLEGGA
jgi:hypothetical protein